MLGYVLDGDTEVALVRIHAAIEANKVAIGLTTGPSAASPLTIVTRFTTDHVRSTSGNTIHVRHSLLPFPKMTPKPMRKVQNATASS
jgi:hypothetical protein